MLVKVTEEDMNEAVYGTGNYGGCIACGKIAYSGCEPDARNYECEACGKNKVFGLEELCLMGQLEITKGE